MKFYQQEPYRPYCESNYSFLEETEKYPKQLEYTDPYLQRTHQSPYFYRQGDSPTFQRSAQSTHRHHRTSTQPVWEQLYQEGMRSKQQLIERHQSHMAKMDSECTFRPTLSCSTRFLASSHSTFLERMAIWQENRLQKIIREKQEQTTKDLKECTFTPKLYPRKQLREISPEEGNRMSEAHHRRINRDINPYYSPKKTRKGQISVSSPKRQSNNKGGSVRKPKGVKLGEVKQMLRQQLKRMIL